MGVRRLLPEHHMTAESRDTVKLAMGLVATMSALLLGLLVSSAKGSYDTIRGEVIQMTAKATLVDRMLVAYGPETAEARARLSAAVEASVRRMWAGGEDMQTRLTPDVQMAMAFFGAIERLAPRDDAQRVLKDRAVSQAMELGELRSLLLVQSASSISKPVLVVVVCWLVVIFLGFALLAPPNATGILALMVSALSVSGAIFLILELDRPFDGVFQIPRQIVLNALDQFAK
jgi:hypothetical protein